MKTELEIRRELREVRKYLKRGEDNWLYGMQQALAWIVEDKKSPSDLLNDAIKWAKAFEDAFDRRVAKDIRP